MELTPFNTSALIPASLRALSGIKAAQPRRRDARINRTANLGLCIAMRLKEPDEVEYYKPRGDGDEPHDPKSPRRDLLYGQGPLLGLSGEGEIRNALKHEKRPEYHKHRSHFLTPPLPPRPPRYLPRHSQS